MFDALTSKFNGIFHSLSGRGRITESNVSDAMREVRKALLEADVAAVPLPLDVVVLGMGDDGHVASLFPGDEAGFADTASRFVAVRGPGDEPRVSLSAAVLEQAREVYLLLRGVAKVEVLQCALGGELPVARLLDARNGRVQVFASE